MARLPSIYPSIYRGQATVRDQPAGTCTGDNHASDNDILVWFALKDKPWLPQNSDEEYDTDLEDAAGRRRHVDSLDIYHTACKRYSITPCSAVINQLPSNRLALANSGLGDASCLTLALALVVNTTVKVLELPGNDIGARGMHHLAGMLEDNFTITHLDVSQNDIRQAGIAALCRVLKKNDTLTHINVSGNCLQETDAKAIRESLQHNNTVSHVDLSHNEFRERGGYFLGLILAEAVTLQYLDLSWNHLRLKGAIAIADGIRDSNRVHTLKLAWNGFANDGARAMAASLAINTSLRHLDLTCNRINVEGAVSLAQALQANCMLLTLQLSRNPITTAGACAILQVLQSGRNDSLRRLELMDIEVNPEFRSLLQEVKAVRDLEVLHGGHVLHDDPYAKRKKGREAAIAGDPVAILMEHVKQSNLRLMDLFAQFDKDNSWSVSRAEFKRGMKQAKVPLDDQQIDKLMDKLDTDKNGEINFAELLEGQRKYRERERKKVQLSMPPLPSRPNSARPTSSMHGHSPKPRLKASTLSMSMTLGVDSLVTCIADDMSDSEVNVVSLEVPSVSPR